MWKDIDPRLTEIMVRRKGERRFTPHVFMRNVFVG